MPGSPPTAARRAPTHVLVVNQHGDNTGDEAAIRGMLDGLAEQLGDARFTVLHQFRERSSEVDTGHDVRWIPLVLPPLEAVRLVLYSLLQLLGVRSRALLGTTGRAVVDAYDTADLVVSAPGGPYFGDPYWSHEPVHWFYVWLARWRRLPTALYAPSTGPFRKRLLNPLRRLTYRCFDVVTLREERSAEYLRELVGDDVGFEVTVDAALQQQVPPLDRDDWVVRTEHGGEPLGDRFLLVVSAIDFPYPGDPDPAARRRRYDEAIVAAVRRVVERAGGPDRVHVAFMPQLHSAQHTDVPYLTRLGRMLGDEVSWEVVADSASSIVQRSRFAAADLVIAGRYHPAVFAVSAGVPVLCIPYEHKAAGLMEAAGQSAHVVDLDEVEASRLERAVDELFDRRDEVAKELAEVEPVLRARSRRTSELVAGLLQG